MSTLKTQIIQPAKGKILVAEPFMRDFYFHRSVVLLAEHNDDGTFGLVMNKLVQIKLNEVVKGFPDFEAPVYLGGPVKTDSLFFIHTLGELIPESMEIIKGIYWGGDIDLVQEMIFHEKIKPADIRFFVGYSGWEPKQLGHELEEHSWVVSDITAKELLKNQPRKMWKNSVKLLGKKYHEWVNYPLDPVLN
jgi:putative transcriptional regulator